MKTTKTKTAVSVALTVLAAGSILAGIYYYGNRNIISQAVSGCGCDDIRKIVKEEVAKINTGGGSGSGSSSTSSGGEITGTCALSVMPQYGMSGGYAANRGFITSFIAVEPLELIEPEGRCNGSNYPCNERYYKIEKIRKVDGGISTGNVSGEGCRAISAFSLDAVINSDVSKIKPPYSNAYNSHQQNAYFDMDNMRNTCEKIAKDGYKCWALNINPDMKSASCVCKKK